MSPRALILPAGRRAFAAAACALLLPLTALAGAAPAAAAVFANTNPITIVDLADASPYPSGIEVSGLGGTITDVNVTLTGITHTYPNDINVLLVGPGGKNVVLMAGTGGDPDISSVTLTFDDEAAGSLPDEEQLVTGSYRPTIGESCNVECGFSGGPPAPAAPYGTTMSEFDGTAPNGTWNLFVADDLDPDSGSIDGGWSLEIVTEGGPTITSFTPAGGPPGTAVTIEGTRLGGVTAVTFGGTDAEFSPGTATRLTATVPHGAETGPIAVTTPEGTATSSTDFTVGAAEHDREVTLRIGSKARGKVTVPDGFSDCAADVPVKVQRRQGGSWRLVGTTQSANGGAFVVPGTDAPGRYRALAKKVTLPSGDVCLKAVSPVVTS